MSREVRIIAKFPGNCLAGAECPNGGKVRAGERIVWFETGCLVHEMTGCEDIFWGNQFAQREAEEERYAYRIQMNAELQSTHWGSDPKAVMAP